MSDNPAPNVRLGDVAARLRRHRLLLLGVTLVFALAGAAAAWALPVSYSSTAVVTVNPLTTNPFGSTPINQQINIATERAVVQSSGVAELASREFGSPLAPEDVPDAVTITSPLNSQVLEITASASDPDTAAATANAVAEAYLAFRAAGADEVAQRLVTGLDERIAALSESLSDEPEDTELPSQIAIRQQIAALRQEQSELTVISINPGRIITTARPGTSPSGPPPLLLVVPATALGLGLGLLLALWRDAHDRRVRSGERLSEELGLKVVVHDGHAHGTAELARRVALRLGPPADPDGPPRSVGLVALDPAAGLLLRDALEHIAEDTGPLTVEHVGAESMASIGLLARRADAMVLVMAPTTRRADVVRVLEVVDDAAPRTPVVPVVVDRLTATSPSTPTATTPRDGEATDDGARVPAATADEPAAGQPAGDHPAEDHPAEDHPALDHPAEDQPGESHPEEGEAAPAAPGRTGAARGPG